jgi:hypothetical protein
MPQTAISPPVNIYNQEGKVVTSFNFHGELNFLVNTVQLVDKSLSLLCPWSQMTKMSST